MVPITHACRLRHSPLLAAVLGLLALSACALCLVYLPAWLGWPLAIMAAVRCHFDIRRHALGRGPGAGTALRWGDGGMQVEIRDAGWVQAEVDSDTVVHPLLTVLLLRAAGPGGQRITVVLPPDRLDGDEFRSLRRFLLWHAAAREAGRP